MGLILEAFLFILALFWISSGFKVVRQQTVALVESFGKFSRVLHPGVNFIKPFPFEAVVQRVDLRVTEHQSEVEVKTKDNMFVNLPTSLMVKVNPDRAADSFYKLEDADEQITRWVMPVIRSIVSQMTLEELYSDKERIVREVQDELSHKLVEYGFDVVAVLIDQPQIDASVQASFNRVVSSKRELEAANQDAEANRIRLVAEAKAEAEGQVVRAEGLAKSRKILSESLEENINTIKGSGADVESAMALLMAVNRFDALREVGRNGNLVLMDLQDSSSGLQATVLKRVSGLADQLAETGTANAALQASLGSLSTVVYAAADAASKAAGRSEAAPTASADTSDDEDEDEEENN
jgi:regulator of protease activity HflC (stomatin/prohibitin superfamily)